jgi:hypothetical protein
MTRRRINNNMARPNGRPPMIAIAGFRERASRHPPIGRG